MSLTEYELLYYEYIELDQIYFLKLLEYFTDLHLLLLLEEKFRTLLGFEYHANVDLTTSDIG